MAWRGLEVEKEECEARLSALNPSTAGNGASNLQMSGLSRWKKDV